MTAERDGVVSTAVRDRSGNLVAALTVWGHARPFDVTATAALARLVQSVLPEASDATDADFHTEVLRGQREWEPFERPLVSGGRLVAAGHASVKAVTLVNPAIANISVRR